MSPGSRELLSIPRSISGEALETSTWERRCTENRLPVKSAKWCFSLGLCSQSCPLFPHSLLPPGVSIGGVHTQDGCYHVDQKHHQKQLPQPPPTATKLKFLVHTQGFRTSKPTFTSSQAMSSLRIMTWMPSYPALTFTNEHCLPLVSL